MKKSLLQISGVNSIGKNVQKSLNGGFLRGGCRSGCYNDFLFCPVGPDVCLVPSPSGDLCHGTLVGGNGSMQQCCI